MTAEQCASEPDKLDNLDRTKLSSNLCLLRIFKSSFNQFLEWPFKSLNRPVSCLSTLSTSSSSSTRISKTDSSYLSNSSYLIIKPHIDYLLNSNSSTQSSSSITFKSTKSDFKPHSHSSENLSFKMLFKYLIIFLTISCQLVTVVNGSWQQTIEPKVIVPQLSKCSLLNFFVFLLVLGTIFFF